MQKNNDKLKATLRSAVEFSPAVDIFIHVGKAAIKLSGEIVEEAVDERNPTVTLSSVVDGREVLNVLNLNNIISVNIYK